MGSVSDLSLQKEIFNARTGDLGHIKSFFRHKPKYCRFPEMVMNP